MAIFRYKGGMFTTPDRAEDHSEQYESLGGFGPDCFVYIPDGVVVPDQEPEIEWSEVTDYDDIMWLRKHAVIHLVDVDRDNPSPEDEEQFAKYGLSIEA
jgi:hypothetical protein